MELRDEFAKAAWLQLLNDPQLDPHKTTRDIAILAYEMADEMMEAKGVESPTSREVGATTEESAGARPLEGEDAKIMDFRRPDESDGSMRYRFRLNERPDGPWA